MNKGFYVTLFLILSVVLSGCFALAEPEESSGAVSAPTVAVADAALEQADQPAAEEPLTEPADETAPADAYPVEGPAAPELAEGYPAGEAPAMPAVVEPSNAYPGNEGSGEIVGDSAVYEIDPARSEARFTINEVLRGADKTVVGVSKNLGGQIAFDMNNPGSAQIGTILISARDFVTDNDFRNNAIANKILLTRDYEFITFEPTAVSGLPDAVTVGETYPLQITGDLTIKDQTREVAFDAEVTLLSESELAGLAALEILYADFGLVVPLSQSVQAVEDNVLLELDFVATRQ